MKKDFHGRSVLNSRKNYFTGRGSKLIESANEHKISIRFLSILLMTALLMPIVFFGQAKTASAQTASIINQLPPPVSALPEPFISHSTSNSSSGLLTNTTLSAAFALNAQFVKGYESAAGIFTAPALPEGFAMAKVPTVWERTSASLASSVLSLTAFITPLLFVSPNNLSVTAKEETNETTDAVNEGASAFEPLVPAPPAPLPPGTVRFDFDGDGKADASRWQSSTGEWKVKQSSNAAVSVLTLGTSAATVAPADYDGDGKTDRACFDSSTGI